MRTLRSKFIFWICLLFILVGALIFMPLSIILPQKLTSQILRRDIKIAHYLSREVQGPLLVNNRLALKMLLEDRLESLGDAIYIFIRGQDEKIITSTFKKGFPRGLLRINPAPSPTSQDSYSIEKFLANKKNVYDISIPLLNGELGELHLGVSLDSSKTEIAEFGKIKYYTALVIFIGLGIGIMIFALLGIFLSSRIVKLKDFAAKVGRGDLDNAIEIKTRDEIGSLADSLNKMAGDLKEKIDEIKKLSYLEERNRLAIDLHDGCAQNIASIIKRLELCERLFKVNPEEAIGELRALRENTKDLLNKTREIMFDLKSTEDSDFNLNKKLDDYVKELKRGGGLSIKLANNSIGNIPQDKSRNIFYIIREALINIKKHAQAKSVELRLESSDDGELTINIKDDGKGFNVGEAEQSAAIYGKLGLTSMRQRAHLLGGVAVINSIPNQGTEVSVIIPLLKKDSLRED